MAVTIDNTTEPGRDKYFSREVLIQVHEHWVYQESTRTYTRIRYIMYVIIFLCGTRSQDVTYQPVATLQYYVYFSSDRV